MQNFALKQYTPSVTRSVLIKTPVPRIVGNPLRTTGKEIGILYLRRPFLVLKYTLPGYKTGFKKIKKRGASKGSNPVDYTENMEKPKKRPFPYKKHCPFRQAELP